MKPCVTVNCEGSLPDESIHERCKNCRASIRSWHKRRPAEVLIRRANLARYSERIDTVIEDRDIKEKKS